MSAFIDKPTDPEKLQDLTIAIDLVENFFKDEQKAMLWFQTSNPLLGDMSPMEMIHLGRFKKLLNFIQNSLGENEECKQECS